jgi:hypothetical protein
VQAGADVQSTVMVSQAPAVVKQEITLPWIRKLTAGHRYRVQCQFTGDNESLLEAHFRIRGI